MVGGRDAKLFAINVKIGALAFKAASDFEAPKDAGKDNVYGVTVKVSDAKLDAGQNHDRATRGDGFRLSTNLLSRTMGR